MTQEDIFHDSPMEKVDLDTLCFKCPQCGSPLRYDVRYGKEVCTNCGTMWSYEIKDNKMIWWQWEEAKEGTAMHYFIKKAFEEKDNKTDNTIIGYYFNYEI